MAPYEVVRAMLSMCFPVSKHHVVRCELSGFLVAQTLAIGGAAGSTAAFCTTPFDVVKTRLQTQLPGISLCGFYVNLVLCLVLFVVCLVFLPGTFRGMPRLFAWYISWYA